MRWQSSHRTTSSGAAARIRARSPPENSSRQALHSGRRAAAPPPCRSTPGCVRRGRPGRPAGRPRAGHGNWPSTRTPCSGPPPRCLAAPRSLPGSGGPRPAGAGHRRGSPGDPRAAPSVPVRRLPARPAGGREWPVRAGGPRVPWPDRCRRRAEPGHGRLRARTCSMSFFQPGDVAIDVIDGHWARTRSSSVADSSRARRSSSAISGRIFRRWAICASDVSMACRSSRRRWASGLPSRALLLGGLR